MFKRFMSLGILLILGVSVFCGCESVSEPETEVETEERFCAWAKAYEKGWLTQEDLKTIAYYYNAIRNIFPDDPDFSPKPKDPEELSAEMELKIKEAYLEYLKQKHPLAEEGTLVNTSYVHIDTYYGTYGDCVVMSIRDDYYSPGDPIFLDTIIGGSVFYEYNPQFYTAFKIN